MMDTLNCPICYERFTESGKQEPRVCPCGHTFCFQCLESFSVAICAVCRSEFPMGTSLTTLPRNLSVVSMLSELHTLPAINKADEISKCDMNISDLSSQQLLELQETVKQKIKEEKRKDILRQIEKNAIETTTLQKSICQRVSQVALLKQLILEEEEQLQLSRTTMQELEAKAIELQEIASSEGIVSNTDHSSTNNPLLDIGSSTGTMPSPLEMSEVITEGDPEVRVVRPLSLNSVVQDTEGQGQGQGQNEGDEVILGTVEPTPRLPPPPPPSSGSDGVRIRVSERHIERDRRRPRPGQIVPEPLDEQANNEINITAVASVRPRRSNFRGGGTVWIDSRDSPGGFGGGGGSGTSYGSVTASTLSP